MFMISKNTPKFFSKLPAAMAKAIRFLGYFWTHLPLISNVAFHSILRHLKLAIFVLVDVNHLSPFQRLNLSFTNSPPPLFLTH